MDGGNKVVRKITPAGQVSTVSGSKHLFDTGGFQISGLTLDDDVSIYFLNQGKLIKISKTGVYSTLAVSVPGRKDGPASQALFPGLYGGSTIAFFSEKLFIANGKYILKVE